MAKSTHKSLWRWQTCAKFVKPLIAGCQSRQIFVRPNSDSILSSKEILRTEAGKGKSKVDLKELAVNSSDQNQNQMESG